MQKDLNVALLFDFYQNALTERQADAVDLYYNQDLSLKEISEHLDISRQGVFDLIKRGEARLFELDQEFGLLEKLRKRNEEYLKLRQLIQKIESKSECLSFENELKEVYDILDRLIEREE